MKIEHAAFYAADIEAAKDFFVKYFRASSNNGYYNEKTGFRSYFLSFSDGARLEVMNSPEINSDTSGRKPAGGICAGYAHLAFSTGSCGEVDSLTAKLKANGYRIVSGPRVTGDGYYESVVEGPEQLLLEITA